VFGCSLQSHSRGVHFELYSGEAEKKGIFIWIHNYKGATHRSASEKRAAGVQAVLRHVRGVELADGAAPAPLHEVAARGGALVAFYDSLQMQLGEAAGGIVLDCGVRYRTVLVELLCGATQFTEARAGRQARLHGWGPRLYWARIRRARGAKRK
jgi:hypothetical protein